MCFSSLSGGRGVTGRGRGGRGGGRGRGRGGKQPVPTADELDKELDAYKQVWNNGITIVMVCHVFFFIVD